MRGIVGGMWNKNITFGKDAKNQEGIKVIIRNCFKI